MWHRGPVDPSSGSLAAAGASVGITFDDPTLEEAVRQCMESVETSLREAVYSADPVLG